MKVDDFKFKHLSHGEKEPNPTFSGSSWQLLRTIVSLRNLLTPKSFWGLLEYYLATRLLILFACLIGAVVNRLFFHDVYFFACWVIGVLICESFVVYEFGGDS